MFDNNGRDIRYLRISITDLCNLRCTYCMPGGVCKKHHNEILTFEEIREIVETASEIGINKVRITGGEPLVRRDCVELCRMLSEIPGIRELTLTTNGILLPNYAKQLKEAGVSRVNISLDTMDPKRYSEITGGGQLELAMKGIRAAIDAGLSPIKLNTVLIGGFNDDEIESFVEMTRQEPLELRFIELMPMGGKFPSSAYLSSDVILEKCPDLVPCPDEQGDGVARLYRLPGGKGRVGIISPISRHFCSRCNRIRLTSEGNLKPCLHSNREIALRGLHGETLKQTIAKAILLKPAVHGELDSEHVSQAGRNMNTIGG